MQSYHGDLICLSFPQDKEFTVGLTTLSPSVSRLSRQCGILNISQLYRPLRPVRGIDFTYTENVCGSSGIVPLLLISALHVGQIHGLAPLPLEKDSTVSIVYEVGRASEPTWTPRNREKSLGPAGNRTRTVQPVARRCTDFGK
jgi:hypothetical protein